MRSVSGGLPSLGGGSPLVRADDHVPDHPFLPDGVCRALTNGRHTSGGSSSVTRASFNVSVIEDHRRVCLECGNATFIGRISAPTGCAEEPPRDGVGTAAGSVLSNAAMRLQGCEQILHRRNRTAIHILPKDYLTLCTDRPHPAPRVAPQRPSNAKSAPFSLPALVCPRHAKRHQAPSCWHRAADTINERGAT